MAAVLLRRLLSSSFEEIYPGLTVSMQAAIKTELLTSIQQETSPNIRKKVCDIAAELSRNLIGKGLLLCFQLPCCGNVNYVWGGGVAVQLNGNNLPSFI